MKRARGRSTGRSASQEKIAKDFERALGRLAAGTPTHPRLKRQLASGKLRIGISSVTLEARRARSILAATDSAYGDIKVKIGEAKGSSPRAESSTAVIERLRKDVSVKDKQLEKQGALLAASVIAQRALEQTIESLDAEKALLAEKLAKLRSLKAVTNA